MKIKKMRNVIAGWQRDKEESFWGEIGLRFEKQIRREIEMAMYFWEIKLKVENYILFYIYNEIVQMWKLYSNIM